MTVKQLNKPQREYLAASSYLDAVKLKSGSPEMIQEATQFQLNAAKVLCHVTYANIKRTNQDAADNFRRLVHGAGWIAGADVAMEMELMLDGI